MAIARNRAPAFGVFIDDVTVGSGTLRPTSANLRYQADRSEARDQVGEVDQEFYVNHRRMATISFYPQGSSAANARSASDMNSGTGQKLVPGKSLTIANAVDADLNRTWIIQEVSKVARTDARTEFSIDLMAYDVHGSNIGSTEITF